MRVEVMAASVVYLQWSSVALASVRACSAGRSTSSPTAMEVREWSPLTSSPSVSMASGRGTTQRHSQGRRRECVVQHCSFHCDDDDK